MSLRLLIRAYLPLCVLAILAEGLLRLLVGRKQSPLDFDVLAYLPNLLPLAIFFVLGALGFVAFRAALRRDASGNRIQRLWTWFRTVPWLELLFLRMLPGFLFIELIQTSFAIYKPHIPEFVPFSWDPFFIALDRMILFGMDGWQLTHALVSNATASFLIDRLYIIWLIVVVTAYLVIIVQPLTDWRRLAILMAIAISWILFGGLTATIFSSAGPIFVSQVYGDPVFEPLVAQLNAQADIAAPTLRFSVLNASELLWIGFTKQADVAFLGISAFPSMHVCMMALVWFYARAYGRAWGWFTFAYLVVILFGSVHLGWHYLVDGLASIAFAWVAWHLCAWFARAWLADVAVDSDVTPAQSSKVVT